MADGHGNWDDLYSIVRSCSPNNTKNSTNQVITQKSHLDNNLLVQVPQESVDNYPLQPLCCLHELQDSYKPFLPSNYYINSDKNISSTNQNIPSTVTYNSGFQGQPPPLIHQQPQLAPLPSTSNSNINFGPPPPPPPRLENNIGIQHQPAQVGHQLPRSRKKSRSRQRKRVVELPADDLSSDVWAWRKYGQKPIKGSPFPRSYYKCSSSRGCPARKQVERRSDNSELFIVSFSGDHTHPPPSHRNSLAGTSRVKLSSSADATSTDSQSTNQKDLGQRFNI